MPDHLIGVLYILAGCLFLVVTLVTRYRPELLLKPNARPSLERVAELDGRLSDRARVEQLLQEGHRPQAVKLYMEQTGASLFDATHALNEMSVGLHGQEKPRLFGRVLASASYLGPVLLIALGVVELLQ